jgi:4-hydroxy-3-polyprenylbenzoate decarboxylase
LASRYFVGVTGASGHLYAEHLIRALAAAGCGVDLCVTDSGAKVLRHELGVEAASLSDRLARLARRRRGRPRARLPG